MIDTLHFLHQDFIVPVVIGAFLLFIVFVWKEWYLPIRIKFYVHVLIALVTLISLAMLALKPMIWSSSQINSGVLLTENFQKERLDSLNREYKNLKVIPYKVNQPIGKVLDSISSLFVLGNGLRSFDFWQLKKLPTNYVGAVIPKGIIKLNYPKEISVGEQWIVRGSYNAPKIGHQLLLTDSSGKEIDSVQMDKAERTDFELSANVKVRGKYVYKILEKDSLGNRIATESLPIQVLPRKKLQILMVNSFPTFESKYLKNFLAEVGNELTVRSQLTRGKFKFEYFNTERRPFYSFSKKQLEPIDLMIIDANSYVNLSTMSLQTIEQAIQRDGLGVLLLPDEGFFKLPVKTSNFEFLREKSSRITLDQWPKLSWEKYPYIFKEGLRLEKVHRSDETLLTAYHSMGRGRIGTTVIQNSYRLLLAGNSEVYRTFWSETISAFSKRRESLAEWSSGSEFVFVDEPFPFEIRTAFEDPQAIGGHGGIPLMQNPDIGALWSGITYPGNTGWQRIKLENDSVATLDYYVMDSTKWKSITAYKTRAENKRQFNSIADVTANRKTLTPLNRLWFFLIFILGQGYLWFAAKLNSL